ncbi:MAG TPA: GGDEF domain-containing protein [Solirubrobacterales bacterium]|jgi:diguanylate cyclase (GGDEF)-like protein|nr:GGDEF domain-containing protein [Solirubrobacterales bacterium]
MSGFRPIDTEPGRLAPSAVSRQRLVERAGVPDRTTLLVAGLVAGILAATAIFDDAWALLPLVALVAAVALGPLAIRNGANPERAELVAGLLLTIAMAVAAGLSGGTSSPLVFLLPIGVVMNALRAGPTSIALCSAVTAVVFLGTSLLADAGAIASEPLPMIAVLAMQLGVTLGSIVLAKAEISHRGASIVDPLTGLLNRQGLRDRFEELRQQALVTAAPIAVVVFDLDHFKRVNDVHGHDVGDRLLAEVAEVVRRTLRRFELVYRIGGEEFLILLPGMAEWEAENVAQQLRLAIDQLESETGAAITASFGVSGAEGAEIDFERLYHQADQALYEAKRAGRDRVSVSGAAAPWR